MIVPPSFRAMPRWGNDAPGRAWLDELPFLVAAQCRRWALVVDGTPLHGSNALVVPVLRGTEPAVLRCAPPGDDVAGEIFALTHWNGRGVVRLLDAAPEARMTLLERLDPARSLRRHPLRASVTLLGHIARDLAIPAPDSVTDTRDIARAAVMSFPPRWHALGGPTAPATLAAAGAAAFWLAQRESAGASTDGDLHFDQVLAGRGESWTVVDPLLLRGDPEYDLGRVLWSRLDEIADDEAVIDAFEAFVDAANVPPERARAWVLVRSMSYLLWGLERGLTIDPPRCERLLRVFS